MGGWELQITDYKLQITNEGGVLEWQFPASQYKNKCNLMKWGLTPGF